MMEWQTLIALAVVALTLAMLLYNTLKPGKKSSCGDGCGCNLKKKK